MFGFLSRAWQQSRRKSLAPTERVADQAALASDALNDTSRKSVGTAGAALAGLANTDTAATSAAATWKSTDAQRACGTSSGTTCVTVTELKQAPFEAECAYLTARPIRTLRCAGAR